MKKLFVFVCLNYCFVFLAASISAQQFQTIQDGIEHAKFTRKIKDDPVVVNLLRLDLSKVRLDVVHALDAAIGTEKTSSMATPSQSSAHSRFFLGEACIDRIPGNSSRLKTSQMSSGVAPFHSATSVR